MRAAIRPIHRWGIHSSRHSITACPANRQQNSRVHSEETTPPIAIAAQQQHPHKSVLLEEVLQYFRDRTLQTYVDCTLGAGGHASSMLAEHPEMQILVGFDLDTNALQIAQQRLDSTRTANTNLHLVNSNYRNIVEHLESYPSGSLVGKVDGIVMDLGVSSMQIDTPERGFSFMQDGPLDMRMDPNASISAEEVISRHTAILSAKSFLNFYFLDITTTQILNTWSEVELGTIIRDYGEEKLWRVVARRIVKAREEEPIQTTQQLVKAIGYTNVSKDKKGGSKQIHAATRTFQAIRIAVNDELNKLEKALPQAIRCLAPGGRLGVISFHGLEDRIVKRAFLKAAGQAKPEDSGPITFYSQPISSEKTTCAEVKLLTRKPLIPSDEEVKSNVRSRSAKLRFVERL